MPLAKGYTIEMPTREPPQSGGITFDSHTGGVEFDKPDRVEGSAAVEPQLETQLPLPQRDRSMQGSNGLVEGCGTGQETSNEEAGASSPPLDLGGVPSRSSESRPTLHLSLSQGSDRAAGIDPQPHNEQNIDPRERNAPRPVRGHQSHGLPSRQEAGSYAPTNNSALPRLVSNTQINRDGSTFIDRALRERVENDIAAFLTAFDAALTRDTLESRAGLREATDRLLRAGARTRIELERLEARVPLPSRGNTNQIEPAWRQR
jgi:hypothetical protein